MFSLSGVGRASGTMTSVSCGFQTGDGAAVGAFMFGRAVEGEIGRRSADASNMGVAAGVGTVSGGSLTGLGNILMDWPGGIMEIQSCCSMDSSDSCDTSGGTA